MRQWVFSVVVNYTPEYIERKCVLCVGRRWKTYKLK